MGLDSPTAASRPRPASSSTPRRPHPGKALAVPLGGAARADGLTGLPSPEHALERGNCSCNHAAGQADQDLA